MKQASWFVIGAAALTASASAQSFNIDFGVDTGVPEDTFAAAGVAGRWNGITDQPFGVHTLPLVGLDGEKTGVTIRAGFGHGAFDDPGTTGNDAALMDDYLGGGGDGYVQIEFNGLASGYYRLVVYGWTPGDPADWTSAWIDYPRLSYGRSGGAWPGAYELPITHMFLYANVTEGRISMFYGGSFEADGNITGIQIVRLGDLCRTDWNGDGATDSQDFFNFLTAFFARQADFNDDGVTNSQDFFDFLAEFFVGC